MENFSLTDLVVLLSLCSIVGVQSLKVRLSQGAEIHGTCCGTIGRFLDSSVATNTTGAYAFVLGNMFGPCCWGSSSAVRGIIQRSSLFPQKVKTETPIPMASASKWLTAYVILTLINDVNYNLELDTPLHTILPWWTQQVSDPRYKVTVHNLLTQTDQFGHFTGSNPLVCNTNRSRSLLNCAKEAYENTFGQSEEKGNKVGEAFTYSETGFYIMGAVAQQVSGITSFNDIFHNTVGKQCAILRENCYFDENITYNENPFSLDPGAGLVCSAEEYAKFLWAVSSRTILGGNRKLLDEADAPHTTDQKGDEDWLSEGPFYGTPFHQYAYGHWRECKFRSCTGNFEKTSSLGFYGTYPWILRTPVITTWGIIARVNTGGFLEWKEHDYPRKIMEEAVYAARVPAETANLYRGIQDNRTESLFNRNFIMPNLP